MTLAPTADQIMRLRAVAGGNEPADLIVRGGKVLMLHNREIREADVAIADAHIAAIAPPGRLEAREELDAAGRYVAPTFIDTHLHIEYTMLTPGELARLVVPRGTTTVLADPDGLANVVGARGMEVMRETATPLRIFQQVSHKVPRLPDMELGGAHVSEEEILERLTAAKTATLGESNPFELDLSSARKSAAALAAGKRQPGHTARIADEAL